MFGKAGVRPTLLVMDKHASCVWTYPRRAANRALRVIDAMQWAGLAQLVEQLICNHQAARSNRAAGTIFPLTTLPFGG